MKKIIIICEGDTEQLFCKNILESHFSALNIEIEYPNIIHSNGGIVKWPHLKNQILNHNIAEPDAIVTTFIDYYGIEIHHNFPKWVDAEAEADKSNRMEILEEGMNDDISLENFFSYIQLHEFEALVFSKYSVFEDYYEPSEANYHELAEICRLHPNPENINNSKTTAPSKRLRLWIPRYLKNTHGIDLLKLIGLVEIRQKCPRFNEWLTRLENI